MLLFSQHAMAQELSFHNESSFTDETKIMHVYGEVRNDSDAALGGILITASFYDANGALLSEYTQPPKVRVLNPGEAAPFEMRYLDPATVDRVANYSLNVTGSPVDAKEQGLTVVSSNSRLDVLGVYYINVRVRNDGSQEATNPIAIATLYDKDGRVVALGEALIEGQDRIVDMVPGQEGGAGIVVAERLQTYKAVRYSIVADSDQYVSESVMFRAAGLGSGSGSTPSNGTQSGCLIATAAFGSELAPQVQALRDFRDGIALKTMAGASFMSVFNSAYYSFSPQVADYERDQPWLKATVRASVYPLLGILDLSTAVHDALAAFNGEAAIVGAGVTASSLIGLLYFAPMAAVVVIASRKKQWDLKHAKRILLVAWAASLAVILAGEAAAGSEMLMFGTALLVLTAIATVIVAVIRLVRW
jgi:peptide/nickel transport system substrate-binding protein